MGPHHARRGEHFVEKISDLIVGEEVAHESVWQSDFSTQTENRDMAARVAAAYPERWLRYYTASKLRTDPVFVAAAKLLRGSSAPLLDVGCGVGLLPFFLRECGFKPAIVGLEIDERKIARARTVAEKYDAIEFRQCDVSDELPPFSGNVALFDVLHYLAPEDQAKLLRGLAARVAPDGLLLIRDSPRENSPRYWLTYLSEVFTQAITWSIRRRLYFPTRESINDSLGEKFTREEKPMWGGSPFNNRLFFSGSRCSHGPGPRYADKFKPPKLGNTSGRPTGPVAYKCQARSCSGFGMIKR